MIETLTIRANDDYINQIITLLNTFPNNKIEIIHNSKKQKSSAFGILKNRIKEPVKWQQEIREESDRDVYGEIFR